MIKTPTKVAILGSTGFVGTALSAQLQQHNDVLVEEYHSSNLNLTSADCVDRLCEVVDDETILIVTSRSRRTQSQFEAFSEDIAMTANVAQCLSRRPVKKCLYFSTLSVYGDTTTNLSIMEDTAIAPTSLYGVAKFAGECMLRQVVEETSTPLIVFRPCKMYGPGDESHAYGPTRFIESILREGKVHLFGDGTELRDHLFIRDLVEVTSQFAFGNQQGTYNLATGHSYSFQEILACLRKVSQQAFDVTHVERDKLKVDQKISPAKLLAALPGFRFTELEQGLAETYSYFLTKLS